MGDTIVGINPLSSVLCVEPQIPISLQPDFEFHARSTLQPERASYSSCGISQLKRARVGRDATVYGAHSPRSFATHHGACMSYACVRGEADAFQKGLSALERAHSAGAA